MIRLIDTITNGSRIEIDATGTELFYQPGMLLGGKVQHECSAMRAISYYLEVLLYLAPFAKHACDVTLIGVTDDRVDPSVDSLRASMLSVLRRFVGTDDGSELKVIRRGLRPEGGGLVLFKCPTRAKLRSQQLLEPGPIVKVRGTAYSCRCSPAMANRVAIAAKSVLQNFLTDVYLASDHCRGAQGGK